MRGLRTAASVDPQPDWAITAYLIDLGMSEIQVFSALGLCCGHRRVLFPDNLPNAFVFFPGQYFFRAFLIKLCTVILNKADFVLIGFVKTGYHLQVRNFDVDSLCF